jgi:uncharacterized protein YbbC (DUF1343 family)
LILKKLQTYLFFILCSLYIGCTSLSVYKEPRKLNNEPEQVFINQYLQKMDGKRACLLSNQAGLARFLLQPPTNKQNYTKLHEIFNVYNVSIEAIFTPEHGISAQEENHGTRPEVQYRIESNYKKTVEELMELYSNCEAIIFNLADAGIRPYTYRTILSRSIRAANEMRNKPVFYLIDTPNPASFMGPMGPMTVPGYFGFLGDMPIPYMPGLTYAELSLWQKSKEKLKTKLVIIEMDDYDPDDHPLSRNFRYFPPSPNLPDFRSIECYWSMLVLEGTIMEEGRGTKDPFCSMGHPDFIAGRLPPDMPGAIWQEYSFVPFAGRYKDQFIQGMRLKITDPYEYDPVRTAYGFLQWLIKTYPKQDWLKKLPDGRYRLDQLLGEESFRSAVQQMIPFEKYESQQYPKLKQFKKEIRKFEIY